MSEEQAVEVPASDRDALLAAIHQPYVDNPVLCNEVGEYVRELQVEAILNAGFFRRRVITDPVEIEVLPLGAVILTANDVVLRRHHPSPYAWCPTGNQAGFDTSEVVEFGPVTVLYDPTDGQKHAALAREIAEQNDEADAEQERRDDAAYYDHLDRIAEDQDRRELEDEG